MPDPRFPLLLLCFFLSGLAGLVYQTAWTREFTFVFGTANLAVATVLAAYMGGLASGAGLAARYAHRLRRPLLAYGLLELGVGLTALAVPAAIGASQALYVALFGSQAGLPDAGGLATALFYLACSFGILLVPTAMMGATLPLLARHAVRREAEIGSRIGLLYAANTTGAVAGTLLAAFALLPAIGLRRTIYAAAALNALVFLAAWALSRASAPAPPASPDAADRAPLGRARWILPLIGASGVVSFGYEVLWTRLLEHLLGGSVYAFATMLASFLAGIALGSALASRLAATRRRAALGFAVAQLAIAALSLAAFAALAWIPDLTTGPDRARGAAQLADVAAAMLTLFPAALAIGATFPLAVRVLARSERDAGPASARVYAANTLGSIVGAIGAGFFAIPAWGYEGTLAACAATNLALAAGAALLLPFRHTALAAAACAGLALLAWLPPATPWRVLRTSPLSRQTNSGEIAYFGVGRAATVMLLDLAGRFFLRANGLPEAYIDRAGAHAHAPVARWLGALPVLARPSTRTMVIVGLGGGVAVEAVPAAVERIEVIELEPEVVAANRAVAGLRARDPLADPRVRLHLNDARNALLLTEERFDAIVSQPSHPWSGGAGHLYTREFFELVRSRLRSEGVFVQWIGLAFVDELLFRSLLATLAEVFGHVRVYAQDERGGVLFLASDAPLEVEAEAARALAAAPADFAALGLREPEDVAAWLLLDDAGVRALARGAPVNRDDHNRLQSHSPRVLDRPLAEGAALDDEERSFLALPPRPAERERSGGLRPLVEGHHPPPALLARELDPFLLMDRMGRWRAERLAAALPDPADRSAAEGMIALASRKPVSARRAFEAALREDPRHRAARAGLLRLSESRIARDQEPTLPPPLDEAERAVVAGWRAAERGGEALAALEPALAAVPARHPLAAEAAALRARWRIESGDAARGREAVALADALLGDRVPPEGLLLRARACRVAGEHFSALDALRILALTLDGGPRGRHLARRGLRVARGIPRDLGLDALHDRVEVALRARAR